MVLIFFNRCAKNMATIPVIVSFGGVNPAGRSSGHHGYKRTVIDELATVDANSTWQALAALMNCDSGEIDFMRAHTLIRKIELSHFDINAVPLNRKLTVNNNGSPLSFEVSARQLPESIPSNWTVSSLDNGRAKVELVGSSDILIPDTHKSPVSAAGQLPTGFDPTSLYQARSHPRGLQLSIFGASDALGQLGIDWQTICDAVAGDKISVYAGSAMSQMDGHGNGGLLGNNHRGGRITSKHVALGLAEMPADFINAYVLGSVGSTGLNMGACATFHYNLRQAVHDIKAGRARVAIVGGAEAPIVADVLEGYITMGALGMDEDLRKLDGLSATPDLRRACRPFGTNVGFTLAEGAQFTVLMDDELAIELGAEIYAAVPDVYVNADGHKKSISAPGVGNYITVAKAAGLAANIVEKLDGRSFIHAHGTGTPANRVSESHIFNETARAFGIQNWPVAAIKCYLGHSIGASGGDQLMSALGTWKYGIIPGIATIDRAASDVFDSNLAISPEHKQVDQASLDVALLNAKGFGGNNATAVVLSPTVTKAMLMNKHGAKKISAWQKKCEKTIEAAAEYDQRSSKVIEAVTYKFDHQVRTSEHIRITPEAISIDGYKQAIAINERSPFKDYL
jgi:acetoacetyl-[acyl-carrier protein] synthase